MSLDIQGLSLMYDHHMIINNLNLFVEQGELLALIGASGSGKTTLMKAIAGLLSPYEGKIYINDQDVTHIPAYQRNVAIVFQDLRLFPHLTVSQNIAFPLKIKGMAKKDYLPIVDQLLKDVHLSEMGHRNISSLSGGQKQRIAMARALASKPDILLLDEPFSGLDESLRESMGDFIAQLQSQHQLTTLLITHDKREAMRYADRIALLYQGDIHQLSAPDILLERPCDHYTADFLGTYNAFKGSIDEMQLTTDYFTYDIGQHQDLLNHLSTHHLTKGDVDVVIRPKQLTLSLQASQLCDILSWAARVIDIVMKVDYIEITVNTSYHQAFIVNMNQREFNHLQIQVGDCVYVHCHPNDLWIVEPKAKEESHEVF